MSPSSALNIMRKRLASPGYLETPLMSVQALTDQDRGEILAFLALRPIHTVYLSSTIRDNGIESPLNRGTFYGCRDSKGILHGVALIGHATLIESRCMAATKAFARLTRESDSTHMIMGELSHVKEFWLNYSQDQSDSRLACRELLFEQRWPVPVHPPVADLRLATPADLDLIVPVHAAMAEAESGINPLHKDPEGFRARCARRIERGRVWVIIRDGRLVFKADVQCETDQVAYLEGLYVAPEDRNQGIGLRCLSQIGRELLQRVYSVSLLVNEKNSGAQALYRRAGYKLRSIYDTIFL